VNGWWRDALRCYVPAIALGVVIGDLIGSLLVALFR